MELLTLIATSNRFPHHNQVWCYRLCVTRQPHNGQEASPPPGPPPGYYVSNPGPPPLPQWSDRLPSLFTPRWEMSGFPITISDCQFWVMPPAGPEDALQREATIV